MSKRVSTPLILAAILGFIAGIIWLVAVRYFTYKSDTVHYHANFALYINGQRDEFKNFTFYEEVQSCGSDEAANPKVRVHLHDNKNDVVHVHDKNVTWGAFFANLGYTLGDTLIKTDNNTFIDGQDSKQLTFILNGEPVSAVSNKVIKSEDRLLISYGAEDEAALKKQYAAIPANAHEYNEKNDPSSCSGGKALTFGERLKHAIGVADN